MNSNFGKELYKIANLESVKNIIEIGSWNGEGSTICIMNGIINKTSSTLYSIEADTNMFKCAKNWWLNKNTENKLILLNGTLHKEIELFDNTNKLFVKEWYDSEKKLLDNAKLLDISNITDIDFIVLDGGEYTTLGDFNVLIKKCPKYIALDDTNSYKCKKIIEILLNNSKWELYEENLNDRNGWAIYKFIDF